MRGVSIVKDITFRVVACILEATAQLQHMPFVIEFMLYSCIYLYALIFIQSIIFSVCDSCERRGILLKAETIHQHSISRE